MSDPPDHDSPPALPSIRDLASRLAECMASDRAPLRARLRSIERDQRHHAAAVISHRLSAIAAEIERSISRAQARRTALPRPTYPGNLPVVARREEILAAIRDHQVVIICGATGSGKTTQLPKICLELGRGVHAMIGHTQPRRIAARSVATRIASELGTRLSEGVGYKVRFTDQVSHRSFLKVMTDGILLAETQTDRLLNQYDTLIIDEAHERSLNIDFLLGYLRTLLPRRPDLKVIITSATIDPTAFANHFTIPGKPSPPVIEVSGRTFPVEIRYRPLEAQAPDEEDRDLEQGILHAVDELSQRTDTDPGNNDILVFLPGEREIREAADALRKHPLKPAHKVDVIPLYARLSADDQQRIFEPVPGRRRIILATNVAETSLTVPGIKHVIDSGLARISRYSPRIKVQRLPIEPVSRASANQRSGRCGRTSPGTCIRLYSQQNYDARPEFTDPEILRTNLASVILQMKALDLGDIESFPFLQSPDYRSLRDGYDTLLEIHALEGGGLRNDLTAIGRQLSRLPLDPRVGRMLIAADAEKCLSEVLVIAAALSTQDPRDRPMDKADQADEAHALFRVEGSDFLGFIKLWRDLHKQQKALSGSAFRRWCHAHFVSYLRFREWHDTHLQLKELITDMGFKPTDRPGKPENIHRALLTGLLSSIGRKSDSPNPEGDYDGARGIKFSIFPGSVLARKNPKWVMAAELVKTTRTYARSVAHIQPAWIESLAQHLVKRTHAEPHWNPELAQACAYETVSLYGLELARRRRVDLAPIDPAASRTLFIHHALVNGEYMTGAKFFEHNHQLTQKVKDLQARARDDSLLADQSSRYAFYDQRLPQDIATGAQFEHWRRRAEAKSPDLLAMTPADVLAPGAVQPLPEQFPDILRVGDRQCLLEYRNDPQHIDDGITLTLPIDVLGELSSQRLDWLVPGLVEKKVDALLRELPKSLRASFLPLAQTATAAAKKMRFAEGDFLDALTSALRTLSGIHVTREHWKIDTLPKHLRMNLRVLDHKKSILAQGRDLSAIRRELAGQDSALSARLPSGPFNRPGITLWDFGPLPEHLDIPLDGRTARYIPALTDEGASSEVALRLYASPALAASAHALGTRRLFSISVDRECRSLIDTTPGIERIKLSAAALESMVPGASTGGLAAQLAQLTAQRAWDGDAPPSASPSIDIRTKEQFEARLNNRWNAIGKSGREVILLAESIITLSALLAPRLLDTPVAWSASLLDIRVQLAYLFTPRFWTTTPWPWLTQYPRYLTAIHRRIDKLAAPEITSSSGGPPSATGSGPARDIRTLNDFVPLFNRLRLRVEHTGTAVRADANLILYRWMIEEYRTALWGSDQQTKLPVSPKRLDDLWAKVLAADAP